MSSFSECVKSAFRTAALEFVTFKAELTTALSAVQADAKQANERYVNESKERRRLHNVVAELKGNIRVFCRIRPASRDELSAGDKIGITPVVRLAAHPQFARL
jgi:Microtubule binding